MAAPKNHLKAALAAGKMQRGLWMNMCSEVTAEIAGNAGFDWCLLDHEHGPYDPQLMRRQLIALEGTPAHAVARVPANEAWILKQVLDLGVQSVLVPMVDTAQEAEAVVRACLYPPAGIRGMGVTSTRASGFGGYSDYPSTANSEICVMVQAESMQALENLDAICATDGVDCVFVGPADLAADMGYTHDLGNKAVRDAIDDAITRIVASGKAAGIITLDPEMQSHYAKLGVTFLGMNVETSVYADGVRALANRSL